MGDNETMMTIGEMAEKLAGVDGTYSAPYLARQIRNMVTRGVLEPRRYRGEGRTAAAQFSRVDLCLARLLGVLGRMGVPIDTLITARRCMNNIDTMALSERGVHEYVPGVPAVIERLKLGELWFFVARVVHAENEEEREIGSVVAGRFTPVPEFDNPLVRDKTPFAGVSVVLDCMTLLGPLVMTPEEYGAAREASDTPQTSAETA